MVFLSQRRYDDWSSKSRFTMTKTVTTNAEVDLQNFIA